MPAAMKQRKRRREVSAIDVSQIHTLPPYSCAIMLLLLFLFIQCTCIILHESE